MSAVVGEMKGIWARLDGGQRLVVISVLFASLVGLGAMIWYSSQPEYVEVTVSGERLQEAREALIRENIAVVGEGRALKVDRDDLSEANFILIGEGITDDPGPVMPDILTGVTLDRDTRQAMLAEQMRIRAEMAIEALNDVLDAKVMAFKPKPGPFKSQDVKPSATASIHLRPGADFFQVAEHAASQVSSATGVPMEFITVMNAADHRKWTGRPGSGSGSSSQFLANQKEMSEEKTRDAQMALDRVFPGLTLVMVNVELDTTYEQGEDDLSPAEPVLKSERKSESKTENGVRAAGDPSVSRAGQGTAPQGTTSSSKDSTTDKVFKVNAGKRRWGKLAPDIKRITSAVFIDQSLESEQARIIAILEPIIGRDPERGDPPTIPLVTEFPTPELFETEATGPGLVAVVRGPGFMDFLEQWGPTIGQVLGVLLVLWFLRGLLKRAAPAPRPVDQAQKAVSPDEASEQVRSEIEKAIAEDPAAISRLLESWLAEQKA